MGNLALSDAISGNTDVAVVPLPAASIESRAGKCSDDAAAEVELGDPWVTSSFSLCSDGLYSYLISVPHSFPSPD